ncbi:MAG: hypothetical protein WC453_02270 [Patescibacteria group bacterium]
MFINFAELYVKQIFKYLDALGMITDAGDDILENKLENFITLNYEKGKKFLSYHVCKMVDRPDQAIMLEQKMINIDYQLAEEYRLNLALFKKVAQLKNADYTIVLYTNRTREYLQYISRLVGLRLEIFDSILSADQSNSVRQSPLADLSTKTGIVHFSRTKEDSISHGNNVHLVIFPEINKRYNINQDFILHYIDSVFLKDVSIGSLVEVN